jgi:hypothetical protein
MKKLILIIAIAFIVLAYSNPTKVNYISYARTNMLGDNPSYIGSLVANAMIDKTTTEKDLLIGTVYTTQYGDREVVTLGMLGGFLRLK